VWIFDREKVFGPVCPHDAALDALQTPRLDSSTVALGSCNPILTSREPER
jgi:hypothetical protein